MVMSRATTSVLEYDPPVGASQALELLRPPMPMITQPQPRKQNAAARALAAHGPNVPWARLGKNTFVATKAKGMVLRNAEDMLRAC